MTRHVLVVCTANVCRSPVAAGLLARHLRGRRDPDGQEWVVSSAGTADVEATVDGSTIAAAAAVGIDLAGHRRRRVDRRVLATDGADLVLAMGREHLRAVVGVDPAVWPRAFTLKELGRRALGARPRGRGETVDDWVRRVAGDRRAAGMIAADPSDDVADPYGGPRRAYAAMVEEVRRHVDVLAGCGPWAPGHDATTRHAPAPGGAATTAARDDRRTGWTPTTR
jgi:protein-tyrosine phosphatase